MNKIIWTTYFSYCLLLLPCIMHAAGYNTAKTIAHFDDKVKQHRFVVVGFYNDSKVMQSNVQEASQLQQFRAVFQQVSSNPKYKQMDIAFIAVDGALPDGATIKQRYEVTGYPSYIILDTGRQVSPAPFSFFKIGEGYLSDNVTAQQLEDFIDQTLKIRR